LILILKFYRFKEFLLKKYDEIEVSHKNICRLLEHIQRQHSTAKKLLVQLQQENTVLVERMQVRINFIVFFCCFLNKN